MKQIKEKITIVVLLIFISSSIVFGYKVESSTEVHQHITKEAEKVWVDIPDEVRSHLIRPINASLDSNGYDLGDDIISGSGEEDKDIISEILNFGAVPFTKHFWQPDDPRNGIYDDGLNIRFQREKQSSYRRARDYWLTYVIPYYQQGDVDRSYYWLGRVAHLIEDATQPGHVLMDCHPHLPLVSPILCDAENGGNPNIFSLDDSVLEEYTGRYFRNYYGDESYVKPIYKYENLIPGFSEIDWKKVDSNFSDSKYLFRLFWYTAQKTQYFASDGKEQNFTYTETDGTVKNWDCSGFGTNNLWKDQFTTCSDFVTMNQLQQDDPYNIGPYVQREADALIPHAMRAVAGLYRLFWDEVNIDWPFFRHTLYRTGVTGLRGDYRRNNIENVNIILDNTDDFVSRIVIADTDGNGLQEAIVVTGKSSGGGNVSSVEKDDHDRMRVKWNYNSGRTIGSPAVSNLDGDAQKEVLYATDDDGKIWKLDVDVSGTSVSRSRFYTLSSKPDPEAGGTFWPLFQGDTKDMAIADLDNDGDREVIFADYRNSNSPQWNGQLYVLNNQGSRRDTYYFGNGGANGGVSVANVDNDARLEIIVPSTYGIYVLNYLPGGILTKKWSNTHGAILGSAAVYDFGDHDLKLIYTTTASSTICDPAKTCANTLYIVRAEDGSLNKSIDLGVLDSQVTPTVADLDNDNVPEIVIVANNSVSTPHGTVRAYDAVSGSLEWSYSDGGSLVVSQISPDLVDINGNGDLEVVYAENDGSKVHILTGSGVQWATYSFSGLIGSALAIGDLDNDRKAEIAVKHTGSTDTATTELSALSDENNAPNMTEIGNLTYDEGDTINIASLVHASDFNNDSVEIIYESPFDNTGQWKADCQTAGNYTFFVEAADPMNLSDIQDFNVEIRPTCPVHEPIDEITGIEGETINITVNASDPQGDVLTYVINDSRFTQQNNIFRWQTNATNEGEYYFIINVSDGNPLHVDSFDVKIIVFDRAATLTGAFNDSKKDDLLVFNTPGEQKSVSIRLKKNVDVVYSTITLEGLPP